MKEYTFNGAKGEETTVRADNEESARNLAMYKRWGPPDGRVVHGEYQGNGLSLISVQEVVNVKRRSK